MVSMYDVSVVGHLTRDKIITPSNRIEAPGGTVLYFGFTVQNLGLKTYIYSKLSGEDSDLLKNVGVNFTEIQLKFGSSTTRFVNIYEDENLSKRNQRIESLGEPFSLIDIKEIPDSTLIHLGPLLNQDFDSEVLRFVVESDSFDYASLDLQGLVRRNESGDVVNFSPDSLDDLVGFDYLHCDDEEAKFITGSDDLGDAVDILSSYADEVIVTMADDGSFVVNDSIVKIPAFEPPELVDTTGCGDTYAAAYLYKRMNGGSIRESGRFASASASLKSVSSGPFEFGSSKVEEYLECADIL